MCVCVRERERVFVSVNHKFVYNLHEKVYEGESDSVFVLVYVCDRVCERVRQSMVQGTLTEREGSVQFTSLLR